MTTSQKGKQNLQVAIEKKNPALNNTKNNNQPQSYADSYKNPYDNISLF